MVIVFLLLILSVGSVCGKTSGPPKHELGAKENPVYTTPSDQISLKCYYDSRLEAIENSVNQRFKEIEEARKLAVNLMTERMAGFPNQFVQKGEITEGMSLMKAKIETLMEFKNQMEGKASQNQVYIVGLMGMAGLLISIVNIFLSLNLRKRNNCDETDRPVS